jgi:hypothetical protein
MMVSTSLEARFSSASNIFLVVLETLCVEHIDGYAGVRIGMTWCLLAYEKKVCKSIECNWSGIERSFTFGSHASPPFIRYLSTTGLGHDHVKNILKKRDMIVAGQPLGYSWQTLATRIAQATPPKYPIELEYIALRFAQSLIHFNAMQNVSTFGTRDKISVAVLGPFAVRTQDSSICIIVRSSDRSRLAGTVGCHSLAYMRSIW